MSKNVRGYCRVSTDLQLDGVSLEVQEARIAQYCTEHDYTLVKIYKEAVSGKNVKREKLQLLLAEVQPREIVVVVDLSRLSRTTLDALQLIDRFSNMNVGFVAITQPFDTTNPMVPLFFSSFFFFLLFFLFFAFSSLIFSSFI